jgi:predicted DNA-binding transcriptional regulator AlpA
MHYGARPNARRDAPGRCAFRRPSNQKPAVCCELAGWPRWQAEVKTMGNKSHGGSCLPKLVGAAVIADSIGWSRKHVYELAQKGQIPHFRIEGSVRFDPIKVKAWLDDHEIAA